MRFVRRPAHPSFIAIGLSAGALGLMAASVAVAADTSAAQPSSQDADKATLQKAAATL